MRWIIVIVCFLVLISAEILKVYFIMPFPGSQVDQTIDQAYWLHNNILYIRLIGLLVAAYPFFYLFNRRSQTTKVVLCIIFGFYAVIFYMFNSLYAADNMFRQPKTKTFLDTAANKVSRKQLVLGITVNNESRAYPVEIIGYHHQVRDEAGGQKVMVTYCTVCRTGRVFKPLVNGKEESFRLVGMDHFNAMFEDRTTGSWWRQVNGEAITGPMKGNHLEEIPSQQMNLGDWISEHPDTKVLQPDTVFSQAYAALADYDEGKRKGKLEKKDSLSWQPKSWIVGIQMGMSPRAYDWIELQKEKVINDLVDGVPVVIVANPDSISHHSFSRIVARDTLTFALRKNEITDVRTGSIWNSNGVCLSGEFLGKRLEPVQSYQEYWHSWQTFHPQTTRYTLK